MGRSKRRGRSKPPSQRGRNNQGQGGSSSRPASTRDANASRNTGSAQERDPIDIIMDMFASMRKDDDQWVGDPNLYTAVSQGSLAIAEMLLKKGLDPNELAGREHIRRPLQVAAIRGNVRMIELLLHYGALINAEDGEKWTALHLACHTGHMDCIRLLVKEGADVNARTDIQDTPIMIAIRHNNSEILEYLISQGGDPNAAGKNGKTGLHFCAEMSLAVSAKALLDNGALVDSRDKNGLTPLHVATVLSDLETMRILLEKGADISAEDKAGATPCRAAHVAKNFDKISLIFEYERVNGDEKNDNTLLMEAVYNNLMDLVKLCLDNGCSVHDSNKDGLTPINVAARLGNVEIGKVLVDAGALFEGVKEHCLFIAVANGHKQFAEFMIKLGADVHAKTPEICWSTLHSAAFGNPDNPVHNPEVIALLLKHGVDINVRDDQNRTALHVTAAHNKKAAAETLIKLGADVEARDEDGDTPLHMACMEGFVEIAKLLIEKGHANIAGKSNDGYHPILVAAEEGHTELVQYLLTKNAPVNLANNEGVTPLMAAVRSSQVDLVRVLLAAGANVNCAHNAGQTILIVAVIEANLEIIRMLLAAGADVNQRDAEKMTPLCVACNNNQKEVAQLLIRHSADVNCVAGDGNTPLILAVEHENEDLVRMLLDAGAMPGGLTPSSEAERTPLHLAIANRSYRIVKILLSRGADVNERLSNGGTPLCAAVQMQDLEMVQMLIAAKADLDAVPHVWGMTAICRAIHAKNVEIVTALAQAGANVEMPDARGLTPLHIALTLENATLVDILIRNGANVDKKFMHTCPPICFCAMIKCNLECVKLLIEAGADLDAVDERHNTALHIVTFQGLCDFVQALISAGADPNIKGTRGTSPLYVAAHEGHLEIAKLLLERGANPSLTTNDSKTALDIAVGKGHAEIAKLIKAKIQRRGKESSQAPQQPTSPKPAADESSSAQPTPTNTALSQMEDTFCCPITLEIMKDPVVAGDGHTYERRAITTWIHSHGTSPITKQPLSALALMPNLSMKHQIELYLSSNKK